MKTFEYANQTGGANAAVADGNRLEIDDSADFSTGVRIVGGALGNRHLRLDEDIKATAGIQRILRQMVNALKEAVSAEEEPLERDARISDAKELWMAVFRKRTYLTNESRQFLNVLLAPMSSKVAEENTDALRVLAAISQNFADLIDGCTEKDLNGWRDRLRLAGFDLAGPISDHVEGAKDEQRAPIS